MKRIVILVLLAALLVTLVGCTQTTPAGSSQPTNTTDPTETDPTTPPPTAQGMKVGLGKVDVTPELPIQLRGQSYDRIAKEVTTPLMATAVAVESADGSVQSVVVSVDNINLDGYGIIELVRENLEGKAEGLDPMNVVAFATHTHAAPWTHNNTNFPAPLDVSMDGDTYRVYLSEKIAEAVVAAWNDRQEGSMSHIQTTAVAGWQRLLRFEDGKDVMYGDMYDKTFKEFCGGEDHNLNLMYLYQGDAVKGVMINITFPLQNTETGYKINADVAGYLRELFPELYIIPIISSAGDQSPYDPKESFGLQMTSSNAKKLAELFADKIQGAIDSGAVEEARQTEMILQHQVETIKVTRSLTYGGSKKKIELHAIRFGDVCIVNNPFELYLEYGLAIKALSMAPITWIGQLSTNPAEYDGEALYLPTAFVEGAGAYSSSGVVGSQGGKDLVEQTVAVINKLYGAGSTVIVDTDDSGVAFDGTWDTAVADHGAYDRTRALTGETGASVTFTFEGTGVKWYDSVDANKGVAEVYIDGELKATVDLYSADMLYQKELFRITGLAAGEHTIKIVCTGNKNESSTGVAVGADYFVVEN